jgi:GT2 family glycosyltransferase
MPKLSIIVAAHNQLGHNQLFLEGVQRYTTGPYQVIVVDSHSTDGSAEFSEANEWHVIRERWLLVSPSQIVERCRRQFDELGGRSVPQGGVQA